MKSYKVRNEFSALKEFTLSLPLAFDGLGSVIEDKRNVVKKIDTDQGTFVVKSFAGMYLFNRIAYSLFRKSKAQRSYLYSGMLNDRGIITPPHAAWIDCYTLGMLTKSYFVSVYYPYETLQQVLAYSTDQSFKGSLFRHLAAFVIRLHNLGIYHEDLSLGNILVMPTPDGYEFALVDLNRIRFRKVSYKKGLRNFSRLRASQEDIDMLIKEYAMQSGQSPMVAVNLFYLYQKRSLFLRRLRKSVRRYTLVPLEYIFDKKYLRLL